MRERKLDELPFVQGCDCEDCTKRRAAGSSKRIDLGDDHAALALAAIERAERIARALLDTPPFRAVRYCPCCGLPDEVRDALDRAANIEAEAWDENEKRSVGGLL